MPQLYLKAYQKNLNLKDEQIIEIIEAAGNTINSSHYLSQTLLNFAPRVKKGSEKLKTTYTSVAKKINSDTYFGRAMKAIY